MSARVVIGYDDDRDVTILHDPTFGPAWEVSYQDFDDMWAPGGRTFAAVHPPDFEDIVAERSTAAAYSAARRTIARRSTSRLPMAYRRVAGWPRPKSSWGWWG